MCLEKPSESVRKTLTYFRCSTSLCSLSAKLCPMSWSPWNIFKSLHTKTPPLLLSTNLDPPFMCLGLPLLLLLLLLLPLPLPNKKTIQTSVVTQFTSWRIPPPPGFQTTHDLLLQMFSTKSLLNKPYFTTSIKPQILMTTCNQNITRRILNRVKSGYACPNSFEEKQIQQRKSTQAVRKRSPGTDTQIRMIQRREESGKNIWKTIRIHLFFWGGGEYG